MEAAVELLRRLEPYYVILVASVGLAGNTVSFLLFAFTRLRLKEVHIVLAILALVDNGFLLVLVLVTLKTFSLDLVNHYSLGCKLSVFLPYLFGFLSIWLIVLFSIERFIVVYFPLKRHELCNPRRNKRTFLCLLVFAVAFYSFGLWTSAVERGPDGSGAPICATIERWLGLLKIMAIVDTVLTMALPFVLIFTLNLLIIIKLSRSNTLRRASSMFIPNYNMTSRHNSRANSIALNSSLKADGSSRRSRKFSRAVEEAPPRQVDDQVFISGGEPGRLSRTGSRSLSLANALYPNNRQSLSAPSQMAAMRSGGRKKPSIVSFTGSNYLRAKTRRFSSTCDDSITYVSTGRPSSNRYSKTTRTLLIISTTFLVLHGPTAALKIWYILPYLTGGLDGEPELEPTAVAAAAASASSGGFDSAEELLERVTCYVYYLHYSLNFFLYVLNMRKFRQLCINYFKKSN